MAGEGRMASPPFFLFSTSTLTIVPITVAHRESSPDYSLLLYYMGREIFNSAPALYYFPPHALWGGRTRGTNHRAPSAKKTRV
jgi:hypothetical protein